MSHDACTTGTTRVRKVTSLQRLKMEALIPALADCEVRSVLKFLNAQGIAPNEIHRQPFQQSFPADYLVAQNCHGAPVVQKIVRQVGAKATDTRTQNKAKRMESALTAVVNLFLHLKKLLSYQRQGFQNDRQAQMSVTQWFQSKAADF